MSSRSEGKCTAPKHASKLDALKALAACFIGLTVSVIPVLTTGTAVMLIPISRDTGWTRGSVSGLISVGLVGTALGAPVVGRLIERIGARTVIASAALLFSASLLALSMAPTYMVAGLAISICGFTGSGVSHYSYLTVLPRHYDRRLGLSLGIAMVGYGLGNAMVPIVIGQFGPAPDWREVYRVLAAIVFLVTLPNALILLRASRERKSSGVNPPSRLNEDERTGYTVREALTSSIFVRLAIIFFLVTAVVAGASLHLTALLTDRGLTPQQAGQIFALYGIGLSVVRFAGGALLDVFDARWVGATTFVGAGLATAALAIGLTGPVMLLSVLLIAAASGVDGDLLPYMTRRYFGLRSYSSIYGVLSLAYALGPPAGTMLVGVGFDYFGGYKEVLWTTTVVTFSSAILLLFLGKPKAELVSRDGST